MPSELSTMCESLNLVFVTDEERLEPVSLETAADIIVDRLREAIGDGLFAPGEQLRGAQLAEQLGVSRGPVREALNRLVQEGLVFSERYRGMFVTEFAEADVEDIYLAREAIELSAGLLIMRAPDPASLSELNEIADEMAKTAHADDWESMSDLDLRFHEALVTASGSKRLNRMFRTLVVETRMCLRNLRMAYSDPTELATEHKGLFEALLGGSEEHFLEALRSHMAMAVKDLGGQPSREAGPART